MNMETPKNDLDMMLQDADVQYTPSSTPPMEIPAIEDVIMDCRFFGKSVLFTGFSVEEKNLLAPIVDLLQLDQAATVCRKLDFLICGSNAGPSKIAKAEEMEKPIIRAEDFFREITCGGFSPSKKAPEKPSFPETFLRFDDYFLMEDYQITEIRLPSSAELDPDSPAAGKPTAFIGVYGDDLKKISPVCRFLHISMREGCDTSCPVWVYGPNIGKNFIAKIDEWKAEGYVALTLPEWIAALTESGDAWNFIAGAKPKKKPAPRRKPKPAPVDDDGDGLGHLDLF